MRCLHAPCYLLTRHFSLTSSSCLSYLHLVPRVSLRAARVGMYISFGVSSTYPRPRPPPPQPRPSHLHCDDIYICIGSRVSATKRVSLLLIPIRVVIYFAARCAVGRFAPFHLSSPPSTPRWRILFLYASGGEEVVSSWCHVTTVASRRVAHCTRKPLRRRMSRSRLSSILHSKFHPYAVIACYPTYVTLFTIPRSLFRSETKNKRPKKKKGKKTQRGKKNRNKRRKKELLSFQDGLEFA